MTRPLLAADDYWLAEFEPTIDGSEIVHAALLRHAEEVAAQQARRQRNCWVLREALGGVIGACIIFGPIWLALWIDRT